MNPIIPYGRQEITPEDIQAVVEVLQSDFLTQGPKIMEFEQEFANYTGANYAVAVSNGTAALHLAVMALGIERGEYVICTPITFAASVNCVKYCGGNVLFADIDPETYLMDIDAVRKVLLNNQDKKIRGIIPVDFAGRIPQLDQFRNLANEHNLWIIEDACHAPGGFFFDALENKQSAGNGVFAELSVFSFHPVKHIATGEGGMITTNSEKLYHQLLQLRTHGITREQTHFRNPISFANGNTTENYTNYPSWYMEMHELGYNYRITDFQAALGSSQLKRAEKNLSIRRELAKKYTEQLSGVDGILASSGWVDGHAYHLYVLEVTNRRALYDFLRKQGIYAQIHYIPVHLMPFYQEQGWQEGDLPMAERYYSRCISIPMFPSMHPHDFNFVVEQIKNFMNK